MSHLLFWQRGKRNAVASIIATIVALHGALIAAVPLIFISVSARAIHFYPDRFLFDAQQLFALTLLYLSTLLWRRKQRAWLVTLIVYGLIIVLALVRGSLHRHVPLPEVLFNLGHSMVIPLGIITGLIMTRNQFTVKSDTRSFLISLQVATLVLGVTFVYGVTGFVLLGKNMDEFYQHISVVEAAHRTIDQFNLTTSNKLESRSHKADLFIDSLSFLSITAVGYCFISLFQPVRSRLVHHKPNYRLAKALIADFPADSESFFKLWPRDKQYFFTDAQTAGVAYGVRRGVAVVVGDPFGDPAYFPALLDQFELFCRGNDWSVAFVHVTSHNLQLFRARGYGTQKLGEEAVIDVDLFYEQVRDTKYFRQLRNKLEKRGYSAQLVYPPHSKATLHRLATISHEWTARPGRSERGFMMSAHSAAYMQQCPILLLRDANGVTQGFLNQLPMIDPNEANFDLLRDSKDAPSNSNDYLLLAFIDLLHQQGVKYLNLGLCPLAGLDEKDHSKQSTIITSALKFVFANGDRFYSFQGLYRFKAKYQPAWRPRYVVYKGGVTGFTRTMTALNKLMSL